MIKSGQRRREGGRGREAEEIEDGNSRATEWQKVQSARVARAMRTVKESANTAHAHAVFTNAYCIYTQKESHTATDRDRDRDRERARATERQRGSQRERE